MSDYDAIVIGAGHNGLTAAAVMARGGLRVLCLEKNQFTGGMASTTELIRGYRFELAGSVQFPVPNEIYADLGFDAVPDLRAGRALGQHRRGRPGADDLPHRSRRAGRPTSSEHLGLDAVLGLAEIMNWAQAPARALGRFEVRTPPKSLDEMFACATDEAEREAIRTALFGTVMDVDRPLPPRPGAPRPDAGLLAFLSVNSTFRGPYTPGSALCMAFALGVARRGRGHVEGAGRHRRHVRSRPRPVRAQRRRAAQAHTGDPDPGARAAGSAASSCPTARRSPRRSSCRTSTPPTRSPS